MLIKIPAHAYLFEVVPISINLMKSFDISIPINDKNKFVERFHRKYFINYESLLDFKVFKYLTVGIIFAENKLFFSYIEVIDSD